MKRMGFEGKLYRGTAGSTAGTLLTIARNVAYTFEPDKADTSDRGTIINLEDVAGISIGLEFEINNESTDPAVAAIRAAVLAGDAVALKTEDYASGWGLDGDFILGLKEDQPLRDAQRLAITASPTDKEGRVPTWG